VSTPSAGVETGEAPQRASFTDPFASDGKLHHHKFPLWQRQRHPVHNPDQIIWVVVTITMIRFAQVRTEDPHYRQREHDQREG
jgi:hypothetical protein